MREADAGQWLIDDEPFSVVLQGEHGAKHDQILFDDQWDQLQLERDGVVCPAHLDVVVECVFDITA